VLYFIVDVRNFGHRQINFKGLKSGARYVGWDVFLPFSEKLNRLARQDKGGWKNPKHQIHAGWLKLATTFSF
jgi:hypothetical protein